MQLVVLTNPESLDIKKNMSTLSEDQINDAKANDQDDGTIIKPSPNIEVSIADTTELSEKKKEIDVKITEHNGIAKINGDLQIKDAKKYDVKLISESSKDNEIESLIDGKTNGSLHVDKPVEPAIIAKHNTSVLNEYTELTVDDTCEYSNFKENKEVANGLVSLNSKSDSVDICLENVSALVDEQDIESEELNDLSVAVTDVDVSCKESAFSPNCDEKDINISEQLLLLDNDESLEKSVTFSIDAEIKPAEVTEKLDEIIQNTNMKQIENNDVDATVIPELAQSENQGFDMAVNKNGDDKVLAEKNNDKDIHKINPDEIVSEEPKETTIKNVTVVEKLVENKTNNEQDDKELELASADSTNDITTEDKTAELATNTPAETKPNNDKKEQELANANITYDITTEKNTAVLVKITSSAEKSSNDEVEQELANDGIVDNATADEKKIELTTVESSKNIVNMQTDAINDTVEVQQGVCKIQDTDKVKNKQDSAETHANNDTVAIQQAVCELQDTDKVEQKCGTMKTNATNDTVAVQQDVSKKPETDKVEHKYITVKKFTDLSDLVSSTNETTEIKESNRQTETVQNEAMDVDEIDNLLTAVPESKNTPENTCDIIQKLQTNNEIGHTDNKSDVITENSNKNYIENMNENCMEVDDVDELPDTEKSVYNNSIRKSEMPDTEVMEKETQKHDSTTLSGKGNETINNLNANKDDVANNIVAPDNAPDVISIDDSTKESFALETKSADVEFVGEGDLKFVEEPCEGKYEKEPEIVHEKPLPVVCKLSNTMDILSDDEDEPSSSKPEEQIANEMPKAVEDDSKCINLDDDDDIMFIEDNSQEATPEQKHTKSDKVESQIIKNNESKTDDTDEKESSTKNNEVSPKLSEKGDPTVELNSLPAKETRPVEPSEKEAAKPLVTKTFLKTVTKSLANMTRNELEDFCILKLVESIAERSNLNEIKNKMKTMAQTIEDLKKKSQAVTKQNRDLHLVVKTVQGDQKKRCPNPMMPMKITRSVGMQVLLSGQSQMQLKKKLTLPPTPPAPVKPVRNVSSPKTPKPVANNIPVPRLVPAVSPTTAKSPVQNNTKPTTVPRNTTQQRPEKRPHNKLSPASSVTVDLTDDEPPAKIKTATPPVRLVPPQNLMPKNRPQFPPSSNSPRKVYIPISANAPNIRPGPGVGVMKNFVTPPRPRQPVARMPNRLPQSITSNRHPAPLPDAMKQYQPPTWKALPPPPDLKLSKVDNGIVISWKFEGYQPDSYEEVASFQLYAYQETPAPPSTALWKKIGDIKALPLPMACTLTQFMSGFKYYFAVRAIDVRSRIGPFSMPGSIMLISKS